ncbi:hypothetical protein NBH00_14845 [Paraconexibacter antarcticus]|uniref:MarR family transcriptional regulator n=1 Tax=Paraconexibacter antarcticus TaxID=2949664 RepID=A0ABY5DMK5_9ACTN|nr:hypothetical protein [Paraconexibacter antarcticus]UTI62635.1 hypothetical protein NBH00_14845 [Paraconexibacter antarcticus]
MTNATTGLPLLQASIRPPLAAAEAHVLLRHIADDRDGRQDLDESNRAHLAIRGLDRTAVDRAINNLVRTGLAELHADRGCVELVPTEAGLAAITRLRLVRSEAA